MLEFKLQFRNFTDPYETNKQEKYTTDNISFVIINNPTYIRYQANYAKEYTTYYFNPSIVR